MKIYLMLINKNRTDYKNMNKIKIKLENKNIKIKTRESKTEFITNTLFNLHITIETIQEIYDMAKVMWEIYETCGEKEGLKFLINSFLIGDNNLIIENPISERNIFEKLKSKYDTINKIILNKKEVVNHEEIKYK